MLIHQTLDKLDQMNLSGMAAALREQLEQTQYLELSFEDRIGLVVDREMSWRESRRLASRLKSAKLRHPATVEDIDFRAPRGLDRSVVGGHEILTTGGHESDHWRPRELTTGGHET